MANGSKDLQNTIINLPYAAESSPKEMEIAWQVAAATAASGKWQKVESCRRLFGRSTQNAYQINANDVATPPLPSLGDLQPAAEVCRGCGTVGGEGELLS